MTSSYDWQTIPEIVTAAHAKLPRNLWDFSCGGAETETTLRRNRSAFDYLAFRPRVLRGKTVRDTSTTFLGHKLALPVLPAPVGSIIRFDPDGALACARAAQHVGTGSFVGTLASPSLEEVAAGASAPLFFQLYVRGDHDWVRALVQRAEKAGYLGIALTVDSGAYGRRERDIHNRFLARSGHRQPNLGEGDGARSDFQAGLTWDDLDWLRDTTALPLMVKGVLCGEDASLAVQHGVDVVYVSNHGGRQLDHAPATIEVLPEIVAAVHGRAEVLVDSGFMRGTDVVKALALGARAVCIGKLMTWALAAGGEAGLQCALELLQEEMSITMANIGVHTIAELGPEYVRTSFPPAAAPWPVEVETRDLT
ncbi:MAG: hypothetical protein HW416_1356 [Chloroflexi bacterium]|nr:hypothetical protein [Chloroflexota bacterium]